MTTTPRPELVYVTGDRNDALRSYASEIGPRRLAESSGVPLRTVTYFIAGRPMKLSTAARIIDALGDIEPLSVIDYPALRADVVAAGAKRTAAASGVPLRTVRHFLTGRRMRPGSTAKVIDALGHLLPATPARLWVCAADRTHRWSGGGCRLCARCPVCDTHPTCQVSAPCAACAEEGTACE